MSRTVIPAADIANAALPLRRIVFGSDPLTLSRHPHHYADPAMRFSAVVLGRDDNTGGSVEIDVLMWDTTVGRNGWGEQVRDSTLNHFGITLTRGEALALAADLTEAANSVGESDETPLPAMGTPYAFRESRHPRMTATGCTPACSHAPIAEGVAR
ncbi:hypothetical protein M3T53_09460 [Actinomyces sp. B33]|uniref:hypothetical protein n=1 Tax=Actinomyces sp. B33 TaxID=2942131 RepID=UPI0023404636|nr:hypothetical protein [Actinomyces sp. B33]MDC4233921.1 hypothetical protein [Actinomyces sp. B33]